MNVYKITIFVEKTKVNEIVTVEADDYLIANNFVTFMENSYDDECAWQDSINIVSFHASEIISIIKEGAKVS